MITEVNIFFYKINKFDGHSTRTKVKMYRHTKYLQGRAY